MARPGPNPSPSDRAPAVGFVTIGQSPRDDVVPEMLAWIHRDVDVVERGALDGCSRDDVAKLAPGPGEARLVSRMRDGSEVVLSRALMHERVARVLTDLDEEGIDVLVLLCTGTFPPVRLRTPLVSAQAAVDHGVLTAATGVGRVGMLVPHPEQARAAEAQAWPFPVTASHASPYAPGRFEEAVDELGEVDLIVMHCMGYDEDMLARVREISGRPTLLARRLVASALRQLL